MAERPYAYKNLFPYSIFYLNLLSLWIPCYLSLFSFMVLLFVSLFCFFYIFSCFFLFVFLCFFYFLLSVSSFLWLWLTFVIITEELATLVLSWSLLSFLDHFFTEELATLVLSFMSFVFVNLCLSYGLYGLIHLSYYAVFLCLSSFLYCGSVS